MRLPPNKIDAKQRVAASKPKALGMYANGMAFVEYETVINGRHRLRLVEWKLDSEIWPCYIARQHLS
ncbi:MAG: hypothetical protein JXA81_11620 [Sedimentisphaerales bacterium]|nr:hypothetical protein [Sedimentisphaerales bacterium]